MNPTLFNWAEAVTLKIKRHLTKCKNTKLKKFGSGSIFGIVLLGTITHISAPGGYSPRATTEKATDGPMSGSNAQSRGRPTDVLEARVF